MEINIPVHNHNRSDGIYEFDARASPSASVTPPIFGALDSLVPGERMRFVTVTIIPCPCCSRCRPVMAIAWKSTTWTRALRA